MARRVKPHSLVPDTVFGTAILDYGDGKEERVAWLRLPSWGYAYDISSDMDRWAQRVIFYLGRRGFRIRWRFPR